MFGYIKPFKPQMKFCEYDVYQSVYCGLCKEMSNEYGFFTRFFLSYDFAFLGLLDMAVNEQEFGIQSCRCIAHPVGKTKCMTNIHLLDYTAAAAVISIYHKIKDDIADRGFIKKIGAWMTLPFFSKGYKKAKEKYPQLCSVTEKNMQVQVKMEKAKCKSIDLAAEPTANIMAEIAAEISTDEEKKKILSRFGYTLGRFVYLTDALDDFKKDGKTKSYNTLLLNNPDFEKAKQLAQDSVYLTLAELADCYMKLEIKNFKPILDNIIYLGLKNSFYLVQNERKTKKHE